MGSDKILMPNIPCTGGITLVFKGGSHGERNCQFFLSHLFYSLNSSWISSQYFSFNSQHEDMITFFQKNPQTSTQGFCTQILFFISGPSAHFLNITGHLKMFPLSNEPCWCWLFRDSNLSGCQGELPLCEEVKVSSSSLLLLVIF